MDMANRWGSSINGDARGGGGTGAVEQGAIGRNRLEDEDGLAEITDDLPIDLTQTHLNNINITRGHSHI